MKNLYSIFVLFLLMIPAHLAQAQIFVDVGTHYFRVGETAGQIVIPVSGSGSLTDMSAIVQIGDGGPLVEGSAGPVITAVSYTGSIWESAPGGFDTFLTVTLPEQLADPGVSLSVTGQSVSANGILMKFTVDTTGFGTGTYNLLLTGTAVGDSTFQNAGGTVSANIINGSIRILTTKEFWLQQHFPGQWENPALEVTVWGNAADPDGDGLVNLLEYAIGTDPNVPSVAPATSSTAGVPVFELIEDAGDFYLTLSYTERMVDPDLIVVVGLSDDLVGWDNTGDEIDPVATPVPLVGGELQWVTKRRATSLQPEESRVFMRLNVEANP